jgi:trans-aconitate 2-methyltransferase
MSPWSPQQYLKFEAERTRPAAELLARVELKAPRVVVDLGCGPGNSTGLLLKRFRTAAVAGIDSSPEMIAAARKRIGGARFEVADVVSWRPDADTGLVFANAVMQWVPDHIGVLARILEALSPDAVLAVQIPDNLAEPNHVLMRQSARAIGRGDLVAAAEAARDPVRPAQEYYARLSPLATLDLWRTTYFHVLAGPDAILEWLKGTGLRPYLGALSDEEQVAFLADYRDRIAAAYPAHCRGEVVLPFPRLFMVAVRT